MSLFEETHIRRLAVKNHFIRSATYEGKAQENGAPTAALRDLYVKLAKGNVGTIITSFAFISGYEQPIKNELGMYSDALTEAYRPITDAVHQYGSKIVMQLVHGSSLSQGYPDRARVLGPSGMKHPVSGLVPVEMSREDIRQVTGLFVEAGARAKSAGFDGVQIHCAHGYLLAQFISPLFNHRRDEYGGSAENRVRIVSEIYRAMRRELGEEYPIWIKMNSSDEKEHGLSVDDFIRMAELLSADGIDAVEVSGDGWTAHKKDERAYYKDAAMRLSEAVDTPVILTGGLRSMADIAPICENSRVELFGFARPFVSNPNFIETLRSTPEV